MECSSEAPENIVTEQLNKTYLVEYSNHPINVIDSLLAPKHQQCTLSIIFINNAGQSDPLIRTLSKR